MWRRIRYDNTLYVYQTQPYALNRQFGLWTTDFCADLEHDKRL